jgi:hypothetical protein
MPVRLTELAERALRESFSKGERESDRCGSRLQPQNPARHGRGSVDSSDNHARKKEALPHQIALQFSKDQAGGQEHIVEPLIGHEGRGALSKGGIDAKDLLPNRAFEQKHFEDTETNVLNRDEPCHARKCSEAHE